MNKSLKCCTDEEIKGLVIKALEEIRASGNQYGVVHIEVSGGKVKFITIEKPIE